jgi:hypothetical protein
MTGNRSWAGKYLPVSVGWFSRRFFRPSASACARLPAGGGFFAREDPSPRQPFLRRLPADEGGASTRRRKDEDRPKKGRRRTGVCGALAEGGAVAARMRRGSLAGLRRVSRETSWWPGRRSFAEGPEKGPRRPGVPGHRRQRDRPATGPHARCCLRDPLPRTLEPRSSEDGPPAPVFAPPGADTRHLLLRVRWGGSGTRRPSVAVACGPEGGWVGRIGGDAASRLAWFPRDVVFARHKGCRPGLLRRHRAARGLRATGLPAVGGSRPAPHGAGRTKGGRRAERSPRPPRGRRASSSHRVSRETPRGVFPVRPGRACDRGARVRSVSEAWGEPRFGHCRLGFQAECRRPGVVSMEPWSLRSCGSRAALPPPTASLQLPGVAPLLLVLVYVERPSVSPGAQGPSATRHWHSLRRGLPTTRTRPRCQPAGWSGGCMVDPSSLLAARSVRYDSSSFLGCTVQDPCARLRPKTRVRSQGVLGPWFGRPRPGSRLARMGMGGGDPCHVSRETPACRDPRPSEQAGPGGRSQ